MQLTNFDLAFCFEKDSQEVTQAFNVPRQKFAPEIEASERHGMPADVWGLGHLATQLMGYLSPSEQVAELRKLVACMMQVDQDARPTMQEVCTSLLALTR